MTKTKKALLIAVACVTAVMGAWGLAACDTTPSSPKHTHDYTYTSNNNGTHNGTCKDKDGKCDKKTVTDETCDTNGKDGVDGACSRCGYKADNTIGKGNKTIASLTTTGVTLTFEGLEAGKEYTLSSTNNKVKFAVGIEQGNPVTFEYGSLTHTVNVLSTEGTLNNVVIKLEEVEEDDNILTVGVAKDFTDVNEGTTFQVEISEAGEYVIELEGVEADEAIISVGTSVSAYGLDGEVYPDENVYELSEGIYYILMMSNKMDGNYNYVAISGKIKVAKYVPHVHAFGEWSEPDEDGIKTRTCPGCGSKESDISGLTATAVTGDDDEHAVSLDGAGTYKTTVTATSASVELEEPKYTPKDSFFSITCGNEPKTYTLKVLTGNTKILNATAEILGDKAGDTYEVILRANQRFVFCVTTLDKTCESDYSVDVAFRITESEAPEEGSKDLPVIMTEGSNSKTVDANKAVYYVIPDSYSGDLAGDLKITFGAGVTVKYLGTDIDNDGEALTSGDFISDGKYEYYPVYLCVTSTSGNIAFDIESTIMEGKKGNPIVATLGADNGNEVTFDVANDIYEKWYKVTATEVGKLIVKSATAGAYFEVYDSVDSYMSIAYGSAVVLDLDADETLYIKASHNMSETYTFTLTTPTEADAGLAAAWPKEITEAGDYNLIADTSYYKFTATVDCTLVVSYDGEEIEDGAPDTVYMTCGIDYYSIDGVMTIDAKAGETYIIEVIKPESATKNKITVEIIKPIEIPFTSETAPGEMQAVGTLYEEYLTWEGTGADTSKWNAGNPGEPATNALRVSTDTKITLKVAGKVTVSWYSGQGSESDILVYYDAEGKATIEVVCAGGKYMTGLTVDTTDVPAASNVITVTLNYDNGSANGTWKAVVGSVMNKPADPVKEGAKFLGWKLNGEDYDFTEAVPDVESLTLVAQWGAQDGDYDITTDVIDLSTFSVAGNQVNGTTATYRGVIIDATASVRNLLF